MMNKMSEKYQKIFDLANSGIDTIDNHYFANSPSYNLAMTIRGRLREIVDLIISEEK